MGRFSALFHQFVYVRFVIFCRFAREAVAHANVLAKADDHLHSKGTEVIPLREIFVNILALTKGSSLYLLQSSVKS